MTKSAMITIAGRPNVGKSTLFNALTGLRQHTGNWPGKTVGKVTGEAVFQGRRIELVDLPGTYSLTGNSEDERIAAEYISCGEADCVIAVCDGSCLERTLILALQVFNECNFCSFLLGIISYNNRYFLKTCLLCGTPTAFPCHNNVSAGL